MAIVLQKQLNHQIKSIKKRFNKVHNSIRRKANFIISTGFSWKNRLAPQITALLNEIWLRYMEQFFLYKSSLRVAIALVFFIVSNYLLLHYLLTIYASGNSASYHPNHVTAGVILFFIILVFIIKPVKLLKTQVKRNRPSWIWYTLWALIILPILPYQLKLGDGSLVVISLWPYSILWVTILFLAIYLIPENEDKPKRFSFDAISEISDGLGFKDSIDGFVAALTSLSDCVSVMSLFGDLGSGKSTFLRMAIERIKDSEFLYTYISLTETNEAKDFSKLFAERWQETLAERYPTVDAQSATDMLKPILRESEKGILGNFFDLILKLNIPISPTQMRIDKSGETNNTHLNDEAAKLFRYIPEFSEKMWIVVIDEVERSKLDEIYRVIEIIERFKSVGARGLPLKLVFIISTSESDLKQILENVEVEPSKQIYDFFFANPKTFSHYEFVPLPSWKKRVAYAQTRLQQIRLDEQLKLHFDRHEIETTTLTDPASSLDQVKGTKDFPNLKEALDTINLWLADEPPRLIERVLSDIKFMVYKLRNTSALGEEEKLPFGFTQMIYMSYIRIKYPNVYKFLQRTIDEVSPNTPDKELAQLYKGLMSKKNEERTDLSQWFANLNPGTTNDYLWRRVEILVFGVEPRYKQHIEGKGSSLIEDQLASYLPPDALKRYLRAGENEVLSEDHRFFLIYQKYQKSNSLEQTILSPEQLYLFASVSRRLVTTSYEFHIVLAEFIFKWFKAQKLTPEPLSMKGESAYHHLNYEFMFHLSAAYERLRDNRPQQADEVLKEIGLLLTQYFHTKKILVGARMTLLHSLYRESRSDTIHFQLDRMMEKLDEHSYFDAAQAVKAVFDDYKSDYVSGEKSIYLEENFFFVLFQYWTGDVNDDNSIQEIRKIALKNLHNYPRAIEYYWQMIPYSSSGKYPEDMFPDFDIGGGNIKPYMNLKDLIRATRKAVITDMDTLQKFKFWSSVGDAGRAVYEAKRPLNTEVTLVAALKRRGLL